MSLTNPSPVYHSATLRVRCPPTLKGASQGGEAKTLLKPNMDLENRHNYHATGSLPIWEGRDTCPGWFVPGSTP